MPAELILAVPVSPPDTVATLAVEVDKVICPLQPEEFCAVGDHYQDFQQLTDEDVREMLKLVWNGNNKEEI